MLNQLQDLVHYQEWADSQFFAQWLQTTGELDNEELRRRASHIVMVQKLFLDLLQSQSAELPGRNALIPDLNSIREQSIQIHQRWKEFLSDVSVQRLQEQIRVPFFPNPSFTPKIEEAILQVLLHTQHHRGQNMELLHRIGTKTPIVDWIFWLLKSRPSADWSTPG